MTHVVHPTSSTRSRTVSPARSTLRRWVRRHLVAMDPAPTPGALDVLDARRRADEAGTTVWTRTTPSH
ncbi:hypothetical protein [Lapillicoccus jejuensis]|uniref:Uncharacterized protein n=1 Tax=Lapillicoccus jejuensis TaxID=402171 RepID=A0A542E0A5_9MICO|nr:hypothetical protein [Lapillicoccus jejuensis]TQJ08781.1 hypothetical protein FB458_1873 [Lapillicoccus jejuensis]